MSIIVPEVNIHHVFSHDFVTAVKLLGNNFMMCDSIWITEREWFPTVLMCWIQIPDHFCIWLSGRSSDIKNMCFCYLNHHCVIAVKVGWKWVSVMWEHMNYWIRVFFNCLNVLNPNIKLFLILVKWNIINFK